MNLKKNDIVVLSPTSLCGNGNAVAKDENGFVYFLKGGVPGDVVNAKIIKITKNYAVAIIDSFITSSEMRISDGCKYSSCGGCVFQSISYDAECEYKRKMIEDDLRRIGGLDITISDFIPGVSVDGYRNKAVYPVSSDKNGKMISGYYAQNSHRICYHDKCLIGNRIFTDIRDFIVDYCNENSIEPYNEETEKGLLRHIYIRSNSDNEFVLSLIINGKKFVDDKTEFDLVGKIIGSFPGCVSVCVNINTEKGNSVLGNKWRNLYGDGYISDELLGKKFRISSASFYQVNRNMAEILYSLASDFADIKEGETILDLYCGTGTIGICLAKEKCSLYGVEITPEAVIDAKYNAKLNKVNADFLCLDAGEALNSDRVKALQPDVIIIDPPRKGCGDDAVERICSFDAKRVVYISCDPATLARDLKRFSQLGYNAQKVVGVDLFPRTGHVECCVLLCRE